MEFIKNLFGGNRHREAALKLYATAVTRARMPAFYTDWGVPDTVEGRFDMIVLHVYVVLRRIKGQGAAADGLGQALFDVLFADVDQNLRELGVGDLGVGKRVKDMASSFYGRIGAYDAALAEGGDSALAEALRRNVYLGADNGHAAALAGYVRRVVARVDGLAVGDLLAGTVDFGDIGL